MVHFKPLGDYAILIEIDDTIAPDVLTRVQQWCYGLEQLDIRGVIEWVPTYTTICVYYDPHIISYESLLEQLQSLSQTLHQTLHQTLPTYEQQHTVTLNVPVCYGGDFGPDLSYVADYHQLTEEDVIRIHTEKTYLVYMIGFAPGFPYLGGMSPLIATPRLSQPRAVIPEGSVGIAEQQTGIYSLQTPGGWRIIGRTPLKLFDSHRDPPAIMKAGYYVRFVPITKQQYDILQPQKAFETFESANDKTFYLYDLEGNREGDSV